MKKPTTPTTSAALVDNATMTSIEIAELTGKRHDNVTRDIELMFNELEIGLLNFEGTYKNAQNKEFKCYNLPKRECTILVSGYSIKMRAAIIDRWQELESNTPRLPQTMPEALRLAADLAEENAILLPKADALDRLSESDGSHCIRDTAKALKMRPCVLTKWLSTNKWIYKRVGTTSWTGYQDKIQAGYLEHKASVIDKLDGSEKVVTQARITAKGMAKISFLLGVEVSA